MLPACGMTDECLQPCANECRQPYAMQLISKEGLMITPPQLCCPQAERLFSAIERLAHLDH